MNNKNLSLFSILIVITLITLGGIVHNTSSSLACPDWPLCYGQVFPKMVGGVLIEHSHRLLATFIGFLTIILVFLSFKNKKLLKGSNRVFVVSCFALFFVILQGILGGVTVIYRLPTIVSTFHLGLSMFFFLTLIYLNHIIGMDNIKSSLKDLKLNFTKDNWSIPHSSTLLLMTLFIFSQLLLGAFIRHSGAGVSCGLGFKHSIACLDQGTWILGFFPTTNTSQVHMLHRYWGILIFIITHYVYVRLIKNLKLKVFHNSKMLKILSILVLTLFTTQVTLGILTVTFNIGVWVTTLHLLVAALLLAASFKSYLIVKSTEDFALDFKSHSFLSDLIIMMKPKLCLLVLLTVMAGMFISSGDLNFFKALFTIIFTAFLAWGAAILNCYIERDVDSLMERTKNRPLPTGRFSKEKALTIGLLFTFVGFIFLWLLINPLTAILGIIASLIYLLIYTPLKQKSSSFLFIGAIVGAIPPVMGAVSTTGAFSNISVILFLILFIWQIPHFIALSIYYEDDYQNADIKIIPLKIGENLSVNIISFSTVILVLVSLLPSYLGLNDKVYLYWNLFIGSCLFLFAIWGNFSNDRKKWSYNYFVGTIIYLPLNILALLLFK